MDASTSTSEVDEPVSWPQTVGVEPKQTNAVALEYLSEPSSSSIAMMRNAFKGLLDVADESPSAVSMEHEDR
ncbi:MAG: hypothetical protein ACYDB2_04355 [Acidimicrobiales bacterium]